MRPWPESEPLVAVNTPAPSSLSPITLAARVAIGVLFIFGCELLIMSQLDRLQLPAWPAALLNALIITALVFSAGYALVLRPMLVRIRTHNQDVERILELDAKLTAIWQDSDIALYFCDLSDPVDVKIVDCNPSACRLYGYARHELVGLGADKIESGLVGRGAAKWLRKLRQNLRIERRATHRHKDGTAIEVRLTLSLVDVAGRELLLGMSQDITAKIKSEEALVLEQRMWRALLDNIGDTIYFKDTESRFIRASRSLARKFGLDQPEALIGKTDADFFSPEHVTAALADEQQIIRTGEPILNKIEHETMPDGSTTRGLTSKVPMRLDDGTIIGTCGVTKDVTEVLAAEEEVRKLSQAVEQSPATIVITDRAGRIEYTNPNFTAVTGYTAEEALGQNPRILKSGEFSSDQYRELWHTISHGGTWRGLFHNRRKNGELYWDEASISPIRNATGKITHYLAVKMDVTARKHAAEELARAKEAAEAAAKAKSEFLANMSHEIRTPMNGVVGMTGLLLDTTLDEEQRQFAETVRDSADSLLIVINDILDFSKMEAGKLTFEEIDFSLDEVLESALELNAEGAQSKGLELVNELKDEVPVNLQGDPGRLRQVLVNFLSNAIKFTEAGEVVLRAELESQTDKEATLRFRVSDSGIGISSEAQSRLFQPFEQADNSTTRKYGGTGLGLAISKQLVKQMHGEVGVDSEEGKGSTFWFTAKFPKASKSSRGTPLDFDRLHSLRVLVVDDNATNRQILRHQIFSWNMQKGSAAGGHQALKLLREAVDSGQPYDVALLDMQMPEMDGMALARAIKADARISSTRLIMLTSLGQRLSATELQSVGLEAYLVKPVKKNRLFETLLRIQEKPSSTIKAAIPSKSKAPAQQKIGAELKVLLAEDNLVNQKISITQIKKFGCDVDVVGDGRKAVSALSDQRYDLVFMDCQMPDMDGYQATAAIREVEKQSAGDPVPWQAPMHIIAMTANAMDGDRERCLEVGMDDYISKPVHPKHIRESLERYLARSAVIRERGSFRERTN
jgi:two-component system, sensor histidine kinase and response regulator